MGGKKRQQIKQIQQQSSSDDQKVLKKMSEYRDYMSMRAHNNNLTKRNKKIPKKAQKHSINMHAHLQPQPQPQSQSQQQNNTHDPISLLTNYSSQQYHKWIAQIKKRISDQKPYTQQNSQLLDALAMKHTNICIYGYGSKIQYLHRIMQKYLEDYNIWEINGYRQGLNVKKIFNNFGNFLKSVKIGEKFDKTVMNDQLLQYKKCMELYAKHNDKEIIIVFHCLDSINFMDSNSQNLLQKLLTLPKIKLICTIQGIKIASVWHPQLKQKLKLRFFHINTRVPYVVQQYFRPNTTDAREQSDQSLKNIYKSLNNNQKKILKLIAKKQLDNLNRQQPQYYTLQTLLQDCIDNVILSNDMQLRENLYQLIDHRVLAHKEKVQIDRVKKYYTLQCDKGMLEKIYMEKIQD